jgi:hypothetical protein
VAVNPTRSQNRAVTTLRSSGSGDCGGATSRAPHALQNLAPSAFSVAQLGQIGIWPTA